MARLEELASFLRARRDQLQPEDVGLPHRGSRRVPGLRREEVAELTGVSTTWYTWLEQGREIHASAHALDALCHALRLDDDERRYVRRLAGRPVVEPEPAPPSLAGDAVTSLLHDVLPSPGCVVDGSYDLLAWNDAYVALYGDPERLPAGRRNLIWMSFANEDLQDRIVGWPEIARASIAYLRAESAKRPENPRLRAVIAELRESRPEFADAWRRWEVRHSLTGLALVGHPTLGELRLQVLLLALVHKPGFTMIVHYPVDEPSRSNLAAGVSQETTKRIDPTPRA